MLLSTLLAALMTLAVPVSALVPPLEQLPDGDKRPVIRSAELLEPSAHNALLEADLRIRADDNDGIDRYEYRWDGAAPTAIEAMPAQRES